MNIPEAFEKVVALIPGAEKVKQLEGQLATAAESITALQGKLSTSEATVADLQGKLAAKDAEHAKAIDALKATHVSELEAKEKDVEKRAGLKAQQIAAGRGLHTPLKEEKNGADAGAAGGKSLREQYNEIKDPKAKAQFYAANREELLSGN